MRPRIIIFDMDGVVTKIRNSWEYLREYFTPGSDRSHTSILLRKYLEGEISYSRWIAEEIRILISRAKRRIHKEDVVEAYRRVGIYSEIRDLMRIARENNVENFAIVSGGVSILARRAGEILGIREVYANHLVFDERGYLIPGGIPLVEPLGKDRVIKRILSRLGLDESESIFIGDSIWDLPGFRVVGYPIALNCTTCPSEDKEGYISNIIRVENHEELLRVLYKLFRKSP
ncbi:MAG: HAD-IB family phosphatase [Sulfolobales archaeon]